MRILTNCSSFVFLVKWLCPQSFIQFLLIILRIKKDQRGTCFLLSRQVSVSLCYEIDVFFFFQASCWCLAHGLSLEFFAIFVEGLQNLSFMYVLYCFSTFDVLL